MILEAASEWGMSPEQIVKTDSIWFLRWLAYREAKIKAQKAEAKKQHGKQQRNN